MLSLSNIFSQCTPKKGHTSNSSMTRVIRGKMSNKWKEQNFEYVGWGGQNEKKLVGQRKAKTCEQTWQRYTTHSQDLQTSQWYSKSTWITLYSTNLDDATCSLQAKSYYIPTYEITRLLYHTNHCLIQLKSDLYFRACFYCRKKTKPYMIQ